MENNPGNPWLGDLLSAAGAVVKKAVSNYVVNSLLT